MRPALRLAAALLAACQLAACGGGEEEPQSPVPALSRPGLQWHVTRGDRRIFSMRNEAGKVRWSGDEAESAFVSGLLIDSREEQKLKQLLKQSRHFRDFVHRLDRAGYGVAPAEAPPGG